MKLGRLSELKESKNETLPLSAATDSIYHNEQGGNQPTQARLKHQITSINHDRQQNLLQNTVTTEGGYGSKKMDEHASVNATHDLTDTVMPTGEIQVSVTANKSVNHTTVSNKCNEPGQIIHGFREIEPRDWQMTITSQSPRLIDPLTNRILVESISSDKKKFLIVDQNSPQAVKEETSVIAQKKQSIAAQKASVVPKKGIISSKDSPQKHTPAAEAVKQTPIKQTPVKKYRTPMRESRQPERKLVPSTTEIQPVRSGKKGRSQTRAAIEDDNQKKPAIPKKEVQAKPAEKTKEIPKYSMPQRRTPQKTQKANKSRESSQNEELKKQEKSPSKQDVVALNNISSRESSKEPEVITHPSVQEKAPQSNLKQGSPSGSTSNKKVGLNLDAEHQTAKERREKKKQAPPRRPTFKRFATQTRENKKIVSKSLNKIREGQEIVLSSPEEDLSQSFAKRLKQNSSQNKAMLVYSSVNDEYAKVSDAGLLELSIVESEKHDSQAETPAANLGTRNSQGRDFKHYALQNKVTQEPEKPQSINKEALDREQAEPASNSKPKLQSHSKQVQYLSSNKNLILAQSKSTSHNMRVTQIQVTDSQEKKIALKTSIESDDRNTNAVKKNKMNLLQHASSAQASEQENSSELRRLKIGRNRMKNFMQNQPIKGNRRNLPQKQYMFADSDFDYNISAKTPNPFHMSFRTNISPTLSKYEGTDNSSKKFDMYNDKPLLLNQSHQRSQDKTSKSKEAKDSKMANESSHRINLDDDQALLRHFQADRITNSNTRLKKTQRQIQKEISRQDEMTNNLLTESRQRAFNRFSLQKQICDFNTQRAKMINASQEIRRSNMSRNQWDTSDGQKDLPRNLLTLRRIQDQLERSCNSRDSRRSRKVRTPQKSLRQKKRKILQVNESGEDALVNYSLLHNSSVYSNGQEMVQGQGPSSTGQAQGQGQNTTPGLFTFNDQERGNGQMSAEEHPEILASGDEQTKNKTIIIRDEKSLPKQGKKLAKSRVQPVKKNVIAKHNIAVFERQYIMVQKDKSSQPVFIPGKTRQEKVDVQASHERVSQLRQSEERKRPQTLGRSIEQSAFDFSGAGDNLLEQTFNDRKKSHELTSIRSQYKTDENRFRKLSEMPISQKIAKYRQNKGMLLLTGREDPGNILGSQQLKITTMPKTTRAAQGDRKKTPNAVSNPRRNYGDLLCSTRRQGIFSFTNQDHQQNLAQINGLLSDVSQAKTSHFATSKGYTRDTALNSGTDSDLRCYSNKNGPKFVQQNQADQYGNQKHQNRQGNLSYVASAGLNIVSSQSSKLQQS